TAEFAEFCPELIDRAVQEGHELGLHALIHPHRYGKMSDEKAFGFLKEAKTKLEKRFGSVTSFRAPQMSRPSYAVLKKLGLRIDSSYHPTWIPGHYNHFFKTRSVHKADGITVVPISVTPLLRLPFSWIWFRNLPLYYSKICARLSGSPLNLYFHPWEFEDVSSFNLFRPIVRKTGKRFLEKLETYVVWCKARGYKAMTMREFIDGR
ncbi:MAG: polysaccharide deacetylase family protein, partial [Nanoarchaeota archaeon]|nr:polysaccharide deacetylase family protein [Nanoarchaeota archaeon]